MRVIESVIEYVFDKAVTHLNLEEHKPKEIPKVRFKSTYPPDQPSQEEWFKEFKVSMLYDRRTVYIGG